MFPLTSVEKKPRKRWFLEQDDLVTGLTLTIMIDDRLSVIITIIVVGTIVCAQSTVPRPCFIFFFFLTRSTKSTRSPLSPLVNTVQRVTHTFWVSRFIHLYLSLPWTNSLYSIYDRFLLCVKYHKIHSSFVRYDSARRSVPVSTRLYMSFLLVVRQRSSVKKKSRIISHEAVTVSNNPSNCHAFKD